jgi:hypothetical protein
LRNRALNKCLRLYPGAPMSRRYGETFSQRLPARFPLLAPVGLSRRGASQPFHHAPAADQRSSSLVLRRPGLRPPFPQRQRKGAQCHHRLRASFPWRARSITCLPSLRRTPHRSTNSTRTDYRAAAAIAGANASGARQMQRQRLHASDELSSSAKPCAAHSSSPFRQLFESRIRPKETQCPVSF